jgi:anti-sigma regulatory factor (Ser/Thr protein kinase)/serine/threonine protein phosphatase PrpC
MAMEIGFHEPANEEVGIVARELASNVVKHAKRGTLTLAILSDGGRVGIEIEAVDSGPGIADVEEALRDGFSTAGSLGCGLGAANRLMDELGITSQVGQGTRVTCKKWLRVERRSDAACPLDIGAATRARSGMGPNGDAFLIKRWNSSALVAIIDGLGHGQFANHAAQCARQYVETHYDLPLEAIFRGVERACRSTRGVVMALGRFDWAPRKLTFGGVGNVEARVFGASEPMSFRVRRGVIGANSPAPMVTEHHWALSNVLVLHSDGLKAIGRWEDRPQLWEAPAAVAAQGLLRLLAKEDDDATVVVVKQSCVSS